MTGNPGFSKTQQLAFCRGRSTPILGCQTLPQQGGESGVIWRINDARMCAGGVDFRFVSHNRHNIRMGTSGVEIIGQTRPDGLSQQMAEQQDAATAHADLEQSGAFALDPDDIVTNGCHYPPPRSGQLPVGTDMQNGAWAPLHEALMSSGREVFVGPCIFGFLSAGRMHPSCAIVKLSGCREPALRDKENPC